MIYVNNEHQNQRGSSTSEVQTLASFFVSSLLYQNCDSHDSHDSCDCTFACDGFQKPIAS